MLHMHVYMYVIETQCVRTALRSGELEEAGRDQLLSPGEWEESLNLKEFRDQQISCH